MNAPKFQNFELLILSRHGIGKDRSKNTCSPYLFLLSSDISSTFIRNGKICDSTCRHGCLPPLKKNLQNNQTKWKLWEQVQNFTESESIDVTNKKNVHLFNVLISRDGKVGS